MNPCNLIYLIQKLEKGEQGLGLTICGKIILIYCWCM